MSPTTPKPRRGRLILLMVALAAAVFFLVPPLLRLLSERAHLPVAGSFDLGTLNVPVLAALLHFAALSMAFVPWYFLFPGLYAYVRDCMEGKLLENITKVLSDALPSEDYNGLTVPLAAERRHIAQLQFLVRCVRFFLALSPFLLFLALAEHFLSLALTIVPH